MTIFASSLTLRLTSGPLQDSRQCLANIYRISSCVQQLLVSRSKVTKPKVEPDFITCKTATCATMQPDKGKIYDKKPFKFKCIQGKTYMWCACGWSKTQPFCDGLHNNPHYRIKMRPVRFIAPESKEYVFCNCKQTSKRPLCDGTHMKEEIQSAVK